jgi:hypothetical protein
MKPRGAATNYDDNLRGCRSIGAARQLAAQVTKKELNVALIEELADIGTLDITPRRPRWFRNSLRSIISTYFEARWSVGIATRRSTTKSAILQLRAQAKKQLDLIASTTT